MPNLAWGIFISVLLGVAMAAPSILFRITGRQEENSAATRRRMTAIYGVLSFVVGFAVFARVSARTSLAMGLAGEALAGEALQAHQEAIDFELWYRMMTPPFLRPACYSSEPTVCALSDDVIAASAGVGWGWGAYCRLFGFGVIPGLVTTGLVWLITRPRPSDGSEKPGESGGEKSDDQASPTAI